MRVGEAKVGVVLLILFEGGKGRIALVEIKVEGHV